MDVLQLILPYSGNIFVQKNVICLLCLHHIFKCTPIQLWNYIMEANTMNPDQTDPLGAV